MTRSECKKIAKQIIKNKWITAFVAILIYSAAIGLVSMITACIGLLLFSTIAYIALWNVFINALYKNEYKIEDMTVGLKEGITNRITVSCLKSLYILLWTICFIIPGIVKKYSYYLVDFISRENPDMPASECLKESERLMKGHKWEMFVFDLSFIGWYFLTALTFGILSIWVMPYINQSTVVYIDKNIYNLTPMFATANQGETIIEGNQNNENMNHEFKYCPNCGEKLYKSASFCNSCGTKQQ